MVGYAVSGGQVMRPQTLICVRDVEASSRWYQRLFNCQSDHGGPNYERLVHSGLLVLQLHRWEEEHHHGRIGDPDDLPPGNGLLLWFEVDDIDAKLKEIKSAKGKIVEKKAEVKGMGWYGIFKTPDGCELALWQSAPKTEPNA